MPSIYEILGGIQSIRERAGSVGSRPIPVREYRAHRGPVRLRFKRHYRHGAHTIVMYKNKSKGGHRLFIHVYPGFMEDAGFKPGMKLFTSLVKPENKARGMMTIGVNKTMFANPKPRTLGRCGSSGNPHTRITMPVPPALECVNFPIYITEAQAKHWLLNDGPNSDAGYLHFEFEATTE